MTIFQVNQGYCWNFDLGTNCTGFHTLEVVRITQLTASNNRAQKPSEENN